MRWNPHVLGALAYSMEANAADQGWGVAPIDTGNHLRWNIDPDRGMPPGGFFIYRRDSALQAKDVTHVLALNKVGEVSTRTFWNYDLDEPRKIEFRHPDGFAIGAGTGLVLPSAWTPLTIRF